MQERILKILKRAGKDGVLQEEFTGIYGISKSTVSTVLSRLEKEGIIFRKKVAGKSYRVWYVNHSPYTPHGIIRVGILKAIEYPAIFLAANDLKSPRIIIKIYKNAFELTKDLAEGYLEVGCSPLITQSMFALVYRSIKIRAGCGFGGGGVVKRVENPRIFGSTELSTMEYMLRKYIGARDDAQIRYFNSPESMLRAFEKGEIEALAIWEPYLTVLSERYQTARFDSIFGKYPCCTLAINNRVENSKLIEIFLNSYISAVEHIPTRRNEAIFLESRALRIKKRDVERSFDGYHYHWKLEIEEAKRVLEDFGIKLTEESSRRIFNLL